MRQVFDIGVAEMLNGCFLMSETLEGQDRGAYRDGIGYYWRMRCCKQRL